MDRIISDLTGEWSLYLLPERGGKNPPRGVLPELDGKRRIPAAVPGEVQLDLFRARLEADPFFSDNYYSYIKYETYGWYYEREFCIDVLPDGRLVLVFEGLDTVADVFVNGEFVGSSEDMFVEQEFDVTGVLKQGANTVGVHIFSLIDFARGKDYPVYLTGSGPRIQMTQLRHACHSFGWDIAPRILTAGIYRPCFVKSVGVDRITQAYYTVSSVDGDNARLRFAFRFDTDAEDLENVRLRCTGACGDSSFSFEYKPTFVCVNDSINVSRAKLWWPRNYGEPNLYTVKLELIKNGEVVDVREDRIGLRSLRLERDFDKDNLKFRFIVNNTPVFIMGTNRVMNDAFHSRIESRYEREVGMIADLGCNMVRNWGGGIYDGDRLYDLCDENGILIWQDFAMGNAGYPQDGRLDAVLTDEETKLVRRIRNHPCVALWSGDNEVDQHMQGSGFPDDSRRISRITRELFPTLILHEDPYRPYVPSSPEIPAGIREANVPEQHKWGPRAYFKDGFYADTNAAFIGESGYHGCPSVDVLRQFMPEDEIEDMTGVSWRSHSTEDLRYDRGDGRIKLMREQCGIMFGFIPDKTEDFVKLSQFIQAQALKFFIENTRRRSRECSGILWWNIIDCWPQISDAIVNYDFTKKAAYDAVKLAQTPFLMFLGELHGREHDLFAHNETGETQTVSYEIKDRNSGEIIRSGEITAAPHSLVRLGSVNVGVSRQRLLDISWSGSVEGSNTYLCGYPPFPTDIVL